MRGEKEEEERGESSGIRERKARLERRPLKGLQTLVLAQAYLMKMVLPSFTSEGNFLFFFFETCSSNVKRGRKKATQKD